MADPRPCSAATAVARAQALIADATLGNATAPYELGTGDYTGDGGPWTGAQNGCDCAGFAVCWCYQVPRHRPGYNHGAWATVSDDINTNSALEDAQHARDLFTLADGAPQAGDLLVYPTIAKIDGHGPWIGHVAIVVGVDRWDGATWGSLDIIQVKGPGGRTPAAVATDGAVFDAHTANWPKPEHRTQLLRAVP